MKITYINIVSITTRSVYYNKKYPLPQPTQPNPTPASLASLPLSLSLSPVFSLPLAGPPLALTQTPLSDLARQRWRRQEAKWVALTRLLSPSRWFPSRSGLDASL